MLAPLIAGEDDPTRGGYTLMGLLLAAAMLAAMLVGIAASARLTAAAPAGRGAAHAASWRGLLTALRDRQFRWLVAAYLVMSTTTHLVLAARALLRRVRAGPRRS